MVKKEELGLIPKTPGVYLMKNKEEKVIYVGKAVSLRQRVQSYFRPSSNLSPRIARMVEQVAWIDFITTSSEVEALALECNLIKEHRPKYNVRLRDDKQYPWLKLTWQEDFPRIYIVRRPQKDGARYYGPFTEIGGLKELFRLFRRLFPIRTCKKALKEGETRRPCLNFHIGRCLGPCSGKVDPGQYRQVIREFCYLMEGHSEELEAALYREMEETAKRREYEKAALARDKLRALHKITEQQVVVSPTLKNRDVFGLVAKEEGGLVQLLQIRRGKLIGKESFFFSAEVCAEPEEFFRSFLLQYYDEQSYIPKEIIIPFPLSDGEAIEKWLEAQSGQRIYLINPKRGEKAQLLRMAEKNASILLDREISQRRIEKEKAEMVLESLSKILSLPKIPRRLEAFDISHLQGEEPVAAMVVFEQGRPCPEAYRRFKIHGVTGNDDYASLKEAVRRRFKRGIKEEEERQLNPGFLPFPDLLIIDGGKGQLNAVKEVLEELGFLELPLISLAEKEEEIFLLGKPNPLRLDREDQALHLLQHIRDEAHRFALTYHRTLREKKVSVSALDRIKGIGPKRKKALLNKFGSIKKIREASMEELLLVEGMTKTAAQAVLEGLEEIK